MEFPCNSMEFHGVPWKLQGYSTWNSVESPWKMSNIFPWNSIEDKTETTILAPASIRVLYSLFRPR